MILSSENPLLRVFYVIYKQTSQLKGWALFVMVTLYLIISWLLFYLAGETELVNDWVNFVYFASTTASTVGYGDVSPSTTNGKLVAALWFFPGAVLIFTAILSKLASFVLEGARRVTEGLGDFDDLSGATVIIGYHTERTPRMVKDIFSGRDGDKDIVILADQKNVLIPDGVRFVFSERLDHEEALLRAATRQADKVLIYTETDSQTFNICLAVREINSIATVAAFFMDRKTATRAEKFAGIDAIVSTSAEMLVRAVQDPGSGSVLMALTAAGHKSTLYSDVLTGTNNMPSEYTREAISKHGGTMVAVSKDDDSPTFSPFPTNLEPGMTVFYIAQIRFEKAVWSKILGMKQ